MTTEEWNTHWQEGMDSIEESGVRLERLRHSLDVAAQKLDELEAIESKPRGLFGFLNNNNNKEKK